MLKFTKFTQHISKHHTELPSNMENFVRKNQFSVEISDFFWEIDLLKFSSKRETLITISQ